jgi:hypothetical protein
MHQLLNHASVKVARQISLCKQDPCILEIMIFPQRQLCQLLKQQAIFQELAQLPLWEDHDLENARVLLTERNLTSHLHARMIQQLMHDHGHEELISFTEEIENLLHQVAFVLGEDVVKDIETARRKIQQKEKKEKEIKHKVVFDARDGR